MRSKELSRVPKVMFINLGDSGLLGESSAKGLMKKYSSDVFSGVEESLSASAATLAEERSIGSESAESEPPLEGGVKYLKSDLAFKLIAEKKPRSLEERGKLEQQLEAIKTQIKDYSPDRIMLAAHGNLSDTDVCYYHRPGEPPRPLATARELATFLSELTSTCTSAGKDHVSLMICYGARTANFAADQSQLPMAEFKSSFAYKFLEEYSRSQMLGVARSARTIHLEAFTGAVSVDKLSGETIIGNETKTMLVQLYFQHIKAFEVIQKKLHELQIKFNEKYPFQPRRLAELMQDPRSEIGSLKKVNDQVRQLYLDLLKPTADKMLNGVIDFTMDDRRQISCTRRYVDIPCDRLRVAQFEQQLINLQKEANVASLKRYFPFASVSDPGVHRWPVDLDSPLFHPYKQKYNGLVGDALITAVLLNFKAFLADASSAEELTDRIERSKMSGEYKILLHPQDFKVGWAIPAPLLAFNAICKEIYSTLESGVRFCTP